MRPLSIRLEGKELARRGAKADSCEKHGERTGLLLQVSAETLPIEQLKPFTASLSLSLSPIYICDSLALIIIYKSSGMKTTGEPHLLCSRFEASLFLGPPHKCACM